MDKNTVKLGAALVAAGVVLGVWGLLEKGAYINCLEMIRAFERGESGVTPLCQADVSDWSLFPALPVGVIGISVMTMGMRGLSLWQIIRRAKLIAGMAFLAIASFLLLLSANYYLRALSFEENPCYLCPVGASYYYELSTNTMLASLLPLGAGISLILFGLNSRSVKIPP